MTKQAEPHPVPRRAKNVHPMSDRSLRARLDEVEQTLAAIRAGDVDAMVMRGPGGERVFTLEGADHGYRVMLEVMSEGVAKLTAGGIHHLLQRSVRGHPRHPARASHRDLDLRCRPPGRA